MSSVDSSAKFGSVLIVAKCNVNIRELKYSHYQSVVLIVAKCNVNEKNKDIREVLDMY